MTSYPPPGAPMPPPPPIRPAAPISAPVIAWLVPVAGLLAVIGAFTPWFKPTGVIRGRNVLNGDALYSWKDGRVGLIAPIALVILSITVIGLLQGKARGRFATGPNPVRTTAKWAIGAGVAALVCLTIAWFLVPGQYHFTDGFKTYGWDDLSSKGVTMGRGPQIGFWVTAVAGVVAMIGGAGMLARSTPDPVSAPMPVGPPGSPGQAGFPPAQGFPPAPQGYAPPQGFPPPPQGYAPPPQGFPPPPPGYPAQPGYPAPGSGPSLQKPPTG